MPTTQVTVLTHHLTSLLLIHLYLSTASHLRVSDTDSDSGSPSRALKRNVHTSASKYVAVSGGSDRFCRVVGKSTEKASPQSQPEVSFVGLVCWLEYIAKYVYINLALSKQNLKHDNIEIGGTHLGPDIHLMVSLWSALYRIMYIPHLGCQE